MPAVAHDQGLAGQRVGAEAGKEDRGFGDVFDRRELAIYRVLQHDVGESANTRRGSVCKGRLERRNIVVAAKRARDSEERARICELGDAVRSKDTGGDILVAQGPRRGGRCSDHVDNVMPNVR